MAYGPKLYACEYSGNAGLWPTPWRAHAWKAHSFCAGSGPAPFQRWRAETVMSLYGRVFELSSVFHYSVKISLHLGANTLCHLQIMKT